MKVLCVLLCYIMNEFGCNDYPPLSLSLQDAIQLTPHMAFTLLKVRGYADRGRCLCFWKMLKVKCEASLPSKHSHCLALSCSLSFFLPTYTQLPGEESLNVFRIGP